MPHIALLSIVSALHIFLLPFFTFTFAFLFSFLVFQIFFLHIPQMCEGVEGLQRFIVDNVDLLLVVSTNVLDRVEIYTK
jgi:hypothetical protein